MTALDIGLGAHRVLTRPGEGTVLAAYRQAVYLRLPAGLCALVAPTVARGPLHLRCDPLPDCRPGQPVHTDGRVLRGPGWAISVHPPLWTGRLPELTGGMPPDRIAEWAGRIGGRGPGLTPAGDDVLAGMLLVAAAAGADDDVLTGIADRVATTDVAAAFLHWAARGQCIAPAHEALAELAVHGPFADGPAGARLTRIGASSGDALLLGLRTGMAGDSRGAADQISTMLDVHIS